VSKAEPGLAGATPLRDDESRGLLLPVQTRAELNWAEADAIVAARSWLFLSRRVLRPEAVLDEQWLKDLHRRMFGEVWAWAGEYRTSDRNLGLPYWRVRMETRTVVADARAWVAASARARMSDDECALRLGYRLVVIHPFANGNGRWSRLASDALAVALGGARFSWGGRSPAEPGQLRRQYLTALRAADRDGDLGPLHKFARS
jgi:Fic-DOC domain mobile mystery protein B